MEGWRDERMEGGRERMKGGRERGGKEEKAIMTDFFQDDKTNFSEA